MPKTPISRKRTGPYSTGRSGKKARRSLMSALNAVAASAPRSPGFRVPRSIAMKPFADSQRVSLRYVETITLDNSTATSIQQHIFSANSMFDPDVTSTGHQPYGFDQWSTVYNMYRVDSSVIHVEWMPATDTASNQSLAGIQLNDANGTFGLIAEQIAEQGNCVYGLLDTNVRKMKYKFSRYRFFAGKTVESTQAAIGSNPSNQAYFAVFLGPMQIGDDPRLQRATVTITYNCVFFEPKRFAPS